MTSTTWGQIVLFLKSEKNLRSAKNREPRESQECTTALSAAILAANQCCKMLNHMLGILRVYPPTATFAGEVRQGFQGISIRDSSLWGRWHLRGVPLDFDDYSKLSSGGPHKHTKKGSGVAIKLRILPKLTLCSNWINYFLLRSLWFSITSFVWHMRSWLLKW